MTYQITIQPTALQMLAEISDRRIQEKIKDRIEALKHDPEKQGKPLLGELFGYRSLRAVGQRYRVLYRIEPSKAIVSVLAIGIRKEGSQKDIYSLAQKLFRSRLL